MPAGMLDDAEPILAELFSVERLEQHARTLAAAQTITSEPRRGRADPAARRRERPGPARVVPRRSRGRSRRNARSRRRRSGWSTTSTSSTSSSARSATTCRRTTTASCRSSPTATSTGYPRVLGIAWAYIAHTDSRFDPDSLRRMVRAYQEVEPLTIGELWAIAISLRDPARREPAPARRADRAQPRPPASGGRARRRPARHRRRRPDAAAASLRRLSRATLPTAARGPALPAAARPGPGGHPGAALARGAARRAGHDGRGDWSASSTSGRRR